MTKTTSTTTTTSSSPQTTPSGSNPGPSGASGSSSGLSDANHPPLMSPGTFNTPAGANMTFSVDAVAIKLPEFMSYNPSLWFRTIEAKFRLKSVVAEQTKFDYVLEALPAAVSQLVEHVIEDPGPQPYSTIKDALTNHFRPNPTVKLLEFLQQPQVSEPQFLTLLSKFRSIKATPAHLEMAALLSKMPDPVKHQLISQIDRFASADDLARAANPLIVNAAAAVNAVQYRPPHKKFNGGQQGAGVKWCSFHSKYKAKARRCIQPGGFKVRVNAVNLNDSASSASASNPTTQAENFAALH